MEIHKNPPSMEVQKTQKRPATDITKDDQLRLIMNKLTPAMEKMFSLGEKLSVEDRMSLYSSLHRLCCTGEAPSPKYGRFSGPHIKSGKGSLEHRLYLHIEGYLDKHIEKLEPQVAKLSLKEQDILKFYVDNADKFFQGTIALNAVCQPLNTQWMPKANAESGKDGQFHRIEHLAYMRWKKGVFEKLGPKVTSSILNLIQREREGDIIDTKHISAVTASLVKIGYDPKRKREIENHCAALRHVNRAELERIESNLILCMELSFYRELFEETFLEDSEKWFNQKVNDQIGKHGPLGYADMVFRWTNEECNRARKYLHETTENLVLDKLINVAITKQAKKFFASIPETFDANRLPDLESGYKISTIANFMSLMYKHCRRNGENLSAFKDCVRNQITSEINGRMITGYGPGKEKNAVFYMRVFQYTYTAFTNMFEGDDLKDFEPVIREGINRAFGKNYLNDTHPDNPLCKSEAMFAHSLHIQLTNKKLKSEDLDSFCTSMMQLFGLLPHQDGFEKYYRGFFCRRIVDKASVSNEMEQKVIEELRNSTGYDFVSKLSKLYEEGLMLSPGMIKDYKESNHGQNLLFTFDMCIVPFTICPWNPDTESVNISQELAKAYQSFVSYFSEKKPDRKLQWLHSRSRGELQTTFFGGKKNIISLTMYQMTIMLMYNSADSYTFGELVSFCGLSVKTANQVVQQLVQSTLLAVVKTNPECVEKGLQLEDIVKLNAQYRSTNMRIVVNAAVRAEQDKIDDIKAAKDNELSLGFVIKASIVRIMKSQKTMLHSLLVANVMADLIKSKVVIPSKLIKDSLTKLIDDEFIARDETDKNKYTYIA